MARSTGLVKWFDQAKGYGFIRPDEGGRDVFVHITAVKAAGLATLEEGQPVSYELRSDKDKMIAAELVVG